ncbi:phosphotyrosyl phosphatase activator [Paraphysoderma sedebokerense]|nr:phosphotyrosyl phosphatase activator [Paraphysoderma sedebokerense]
MTANGHNAFCVPRRKIITKDDLTHFLDSQACNDYLNFILKLNTSVQGLKISDNVGASPIIQQLLSLLDSIAAIATSTPPDKTTKSRFGNPAFRLFIDKTVQALPDLLEDFIIPREAIIEVAKYLERSFGDRKRIDYGTGHEANFMAFLHCLDKLKLFQDEDYAPLVLQVFVRYMRVMRTLQFDYWLEPAGSHGVWGLDDYHSLPFMFGSSQLIEHKYIRPKSIHDRDLVSEYAKDYLYLSCIDFINTVKTSASLRWHSPMLDDISIVKTWSKINEGMVKLYKGEVLSKLPIMQHFMFGSLISFDNVSGKEVNEEETGTDGHTHIYAMGQEFPTCCGMRLPSAIAAREAGRMERGLPFD